MTKRTSLGFFLVTLALGCHGKAADDSGSKVTPADDSGAQETGQTAEDEPDCAEAEARLGYPACVPRIPDEQTFEDVTLTATTVDELRVGSWVEIQEDEEHKLRGKLAAIIKPTGKYIFVNRTGMKVMEKTRMGLAVEFRRGAIRLLDDALLFDRALESVIGNLRKLKGA